MNICRCLPSLSVLASAFAAVAVGSASLQAQQAPPPPPTAASQAAPASKTPPLTGGQAANASANGEGDKTIVLEPFEVQASNTGYYAPNSVSATRFNSKLEDIGSSITVVTKQQMQDFQMLDINDVFMYAADTMGTATFTDNPINRNGDPTDNVQASPNTANRIRGISAANISFANFETTGRVPLDPIVSDAIEIFRGPNATVFGLGNPGGTVNTDPAMPLLDKSLTNIETRGDSTGGYRESLDVSMPILQGKLGVRFSGVFQHDAFDRKPSGVNTVRYNGMIKYHPFSKTTIEGAVYWYRMDGRRPNFTTPRDYVSYWLQSGKPTWDPVTQTIHVGGQTLGPFTASTYNGPNYFENTFTGSPHSQVFVAPDAFYWSAPGTANSNTTPITGGSVKGLTDRYMSTSPDAATNLGKYLNQPLFSATPAISNKGIYDWTKYNISAINFAMDEALTTYAAIDQNIFTTELQSLNVQLAVFKEDTNSYRRNLVGTANSNGQSGQLFVDVNERNLDGSPNPFFLRPYIGTDQPITQFLPENWTTYRAQGGYTLDLADTQKGLLKWFGSHTLSGYYEYKYRVDRVYSFKDSFNPVPAWYPTGYTGVSEQGSISGGPGAGPNITKNYYRYYVGNANDTGQVNYAPVDFAYGPHSYVWGNSSTGGTFHTEQDTLGQVAVADGAGGGNNTKVEYKTRGALIQDHWLDDSLVTTGGVREDFYYTKFGGTQQLNPDGVSYNYAAMNSWAPGDWSLASGRTKQADAMLRPFKDFFWLQGKLSGMPAVGGALAEAARTMGFYFDKSDSFIPQSPAQDLFGNLLPNQFGKGKEWGMQFTTLNNTLHIRLGRYIDKSIDNRQGDASVLSQRVTRLDFQVSGDKFPLWTQAENWVGSLNPTWSHDQIEAEVSKEVGIPVAEEQGFISPKPPLAATQDIVASGTDLEINYNPNQFWSLTANATQSHVINSNVSTTIQTWINQRMPIWTTIVDPRTSTLWWNTNYGGSQTPAQNFATFVQAPYDLIQQQNGKTNPQYPEYNVRLASNYKLAGMFETGLLSHLNVTTAVRWQSRYAIGYYGLQQLPDVITQLDASRPIWGERLYWHLDLGLGYQTLLYGGRVRAKFQLLCRDLTEPGHLQPINAYPDGTPVAYRIIDPRQWILSAQFDL